MNEILPKPKFNNLNLTLIKTFYLNSKKFFADPFLYSIALGVWAYNIMQEAKIVELADNYSLFYIKNETPLLTLFFNTAVHYFNVEAERDAYKDISAEHINEFLADLKKATDNAYTIINNLYYKIDQRIVNMMYTQYTIWVLGVLYGFYSDDFDKVSDVILKSELPTIKLIRGEIKRERLPLSSTK
ncbi:hypothetical protein SFV1gp25 [Sulfolobus filamentous virus 1]|uniref:Uncharacterized protein n=1 Tax=Sulfolobus filamentous virus 1 TaxID=2304198 RepID=A0A346LU64_SUFV1|nr:hypothetical protein HOT91_gp25 [Sulfolobus filamentous virus 1]AXQ00107.1 hypothetical protein SFV1gp25 [Sulfolobus filamentous virus 1]